jgi:hypothetical protein
MSWRIILGLTLLLIGMMELYSVMANSEVVRQKMSPVYMEAGCVIWMAVGVLLIVKGMKDKKQ